VASSRRTEVLRSNGGLCHYCRRARATTVDHIVPKCDGGPTRDWNLAPACGDCNRVKGRRRQFCRCFRCIQAERIFAGVARPTMARSRRRKAA
jgi:hypothetical protein